MTRQQADEALDLYAQLGQLAREVAETRAAVFTGFVQIHGRLDGIGDKVDAQGKILTHLCTELESDVRPRLDSISNEVEDTGERAIAAAERAENAEHRTERMQQVIVNLRRERAARRRAELRVGKLRRRVLVAFALGFITTAGGIAAAVTYQSCAHVARPVPVEVTP